MVLRKGKNFYFWKSLDVIGEKIKELENDNLYIILTSEKKLAKRSPKLNKARISRKSR